MLCFKKISGVFGMGQNVEKRVAAIEEKYRKMTDKLIDAIWVIDAETFKYLYISPDINTIRGFSQEELLGTTIEKNFTRESYDKVKELFQKGKKDFAAGLHKSCTTEVELYHKNGSRIWFEISAKFIKEKNEPLKIVGITRDIDKRKKAEKRQEEINRELKKALKEKEELLNKIRKLESILPICSGCRRIRDEENKWWPIEKYIEKKADSKFSHTICPDCRVIYYPDA